MIQDTEVLITVHGNKLDQAGVNFITGWVYVGANLAGFCHTY